MTHKQRKEAEDKLCWISFDGKGIKLLQKGRKFMYTQIYSLGDPETNPQNTLACSFTAKQIDIKKKVEIYFLSLLLCVWRAAL